MFKQCVIAMIAGLMFGMGLIVSGMANPQTVLAFLDISRDWNPSLLFVMSGAISVSFFAFKKMQVRTCSLLGNQIQLPPTTQIDRRLVIGAVIFGIGWGLAGFCPGPALVALSFGSPKQWIFVLGMLSGMGFYSILQHQCLHFSK